MTWHSPHDPFVPPILASYKALIFEVGGKRAWYTLHSHALETPEESHTVVYCSVLFNYSGMLPDKFLLVVMKVLWLVSLKKSLQSTPTTLYIHH